MLIKIKRADFYSFNDNDLGWVCIEPIIQKIRGRELNIKSQVYAQLTRGQKALFMFWVLYGHSNNGIIQFYNEMDYLIKNVDIWSELKSASAYFDDEGLLQILKEMEKIYYILQKQQMENYGIETNHMGLKLQEDINLLDERFHKVIKLSFRKIGVYVRKNPDEFVYFVN